MITDKFTSRFAFIWAAAGASIGLGNIWAFPFIAGQYGGGGFLLIYLAALLLLAAPALVAELVLGRMGQASPSTALSHVKQEVGGFGPWFLMGWVGIIANILVLSFYIVIAGHALHFTYYAMTNGFSHLSSGAISAISNGFLSSMSEAGSWALLFLGLTAVIVSFRISKGLERAGQLLMPLLFIMLVISAGYAGFQGDFIGALTFLLGFEGFDLNGGVVMAAVGQAFFTLSVGVGSMMMYGAYMKKTDPLPSAVAWIVGMDLTAALLAGLAIFPLVIAYNIKGNAGPDLIFVTLPLLFAKLPYGDGFATLFFALVSLAALTSSIAMMAPIVQRLQEAKLPRLLATLLVGLVVLVLSYMTLLSFGPLYDYYPLAFFPPAAELNMFDLIREGVTSVIMPLGGLIFLLIAGWAVPRPRLRAALVMGGGVMFSIFASVIQYIAPLLLVGLIISEWT